MAPATLEGGPAGKERDTREHAGGPERSTRGTLPRRSSSAPSAEQFLSEATVRTHVSRIVDKLGVRDRVGAVVVAPESGLVRPGLPGTPADRLGP